MQNLNPAIDSDILVYRCGHAAKDDEPLEYVLATVKRAVEGILENFPGRKEQRLYLTGKGNFRDTLATIQTYKGNRSPDSKPKYYKEIRDYLVDVWNAEVIEGQEADDAMGIYQWSHKDKSTCIVSIDKDLRMIPGYHYNFVKGVIDYVDLPQANYNFFRQTLTGDRSDNIPGISGVGEKRSEKLLAPANNNVVDMKRICMEQYKKEFGEYAESCWKEISNLLWIRREENQECPF